MPLFQLVREVEKTYIEDEIYHIDPTEIEELANDATLEEIQDWLRNLDNPYELDPMFKAHESTNEGDFKWDKDQCKRLD